MTVLSEFMVTVQLLPVQAPDQPLKVELASALSSNVTTVPAENLSVQSEPQFIPGPLTVPEPLPPLVTVSKNV